MPQNVQKTLKIITRMSLRNGILEIATATATMLAIVNKLARAEEESAPTHQYRGQ